METGEQIENQRQHNAQEDGSSEWEVDRHVLATIGKIAGQFAQGESDPAENQDNGASDQQEEA